MSKSPPARSPLPWDYRLQKNGTDSRKDRFVIGSSNGHAIAWTDTVALGQEGEAQANAAYAVSAANLLPEMVKALEKEHVHWAGAGPLKDCESCQILSRAKEVLGQR